MHRATRRNLTLLAAAFALAALALLRPGRQPPAPPQPITTLDAASVSAIDISREGQADLRLRRRKGNWEMHSPFAAPADADKVHALLRLVSLTSAVRLDVAVQDLGRFGLAPPKARIALDGEVFAFGDAHPLDARRYVLHGERVYLLNDVTYHHLIAEPGAFLSRRLLPPAAELIGVVTPNYTIRRQPPGWRLLRGGLGNPQRGAEQVARAWTDARAERVLTHPSTAASGEVILQFRQAADIKLQLIAKDAAVLLGRSDWGVAYELTPAAAQTLGLMPALDMAG